jgi:tRNA (guanine37-N1)-methyltransferase
MRLLRKISEKLGREIESGIDIVGDIAILKLPNMEEQKKKEICEIIASEIKNVKTIFEQTSPVEGEYRVRKLRHLYGVDKTLTIHKENGISLKVDVARCYFSPRLSTERMRIASQCKTGEKVLNMFAGVGPFSILIAKKAGCEVVSCELNKYACSLHKENSLINKVDSLVNVINTDSGYLSSMIREDFDRVLIPLPSSSNNYLQIARNFVRKGGIMHYYRHVGGRDEDDAKARLEAELRATLHEAQLSLRKVREVGPRFFELVADIKL